MDLHWRLKISDFKKFLWITKVALIHFCFFGHLLWTLFVDTLRFLSTSVRYGIGATIRNG